MNLQEPDNHFDAGGSVFSRKKHLAALGSIFVVALLIRLYGADFGLEAGGSWHPNEVTTLALRVAAGDMDPEWYSYPSLQIYILGTADAAWHFLVSITGAVTGRNGEADILDFYEARPAVPPLLGRSISAFLGALLPLLVYLAAAAAFNRRAALIASLFSALNPIASLEAHYATVDTMLLAAYTACLYFSLKIIRHPRLAWYSASGLAAGLALSTKQPGILAFLFPAAAHMLRVGTEPADLQERIRSGFPLLLAIVAGTAAFCVTSPYYILNAISGHGVLQTHIASVAGFAADSPLPFFERFRYYSLFGSYGEFFEIFHSGSGTTFSLLAAGGVLLLAFRPRREAALLLFSLLITILIMGGFAVQTPRYVLLVIPAAAIAAGIAAERLIRAVGSRSAFIRVFVMAAVVLLPAISIGSAAFSLSAELAKEDTRDTATRWLREELPGEGRVLVEGPGEIGPSLPAGSRTRFAAPEFNRGTDDLPPSGILPLSGIIDCRKSGVRFVATSTLKNSYEHQVLERSIITDPDAVLLAEFRKSASLRRNRLEAYGFHNPEIRIYRLDYPDENRRNVQFRCLPGPFRNEGNSVFSCAVPLPAGDHCSLLDRNIIVLPFEDEQPLIPFRHYDNRTSLFSKTENERTPELSPGEFREKGGRLFIRTSDGADPGRNGREYTFTVVDNYIGHYRELLVWISTGLDENARFLFDYFHLFRCAQRLRLTQTEVGYPMTRGYTALTHYCHLKNVEYLILTELSFFSRRPIFSPYLEFTDARGFGLCRDDALPGWSVVLRDANRKCRFLVFKLNGNTGSPLTVNERIPPGRFRRWPRSAQAPQDSHPSI